MNKDVHINAYTLFADMHAYLRNYTQVFMNAQKHTMHPHKHVSMCLHTCAVIHTFTYIHPTCTLEVSGCTLVIVMALAFILEIRPL